MMLNGLDREHDNLRAALSLLRESDAEKYLELAGALAWFWHARSYLMEGRDHLIPALALSAATAAQDAHAAFGPPAPLRLCTGSGGIDSLMAEGLQMWREVGAEAEVANALEGLGWTYFLSGDDEKACASFEECLRLQRETGDPHLVNRAKVALGQALVALGRVEETRSLAAEMIAFSRQHGNIRTEHSGWHYTADCELIEGNYAESLRLYGTSLALAQEIGNGIEIGFEVQVVGMSLSGLGQSERALWLAGAVEAECERIGSTLHVRFWNALLSKRFDAAREALGPHDAARAWAAGRAMSFEAAIEQALEAARKIRPVNLEKVRQHYLYSFPRRRAGAVGRRPRLQGRRQDVRGRRHRAVRPSPVLQVLGQRRSPSWSNAREWSRRPTSRARSGWRWSASMPWAMVRSRTASATPTR